MASITLTIPSKELTELFNTIEKTVSVNDSDIKLELLQDIQNQYKAITKGINIGIFNSIIIY